MKPYKVDRNRWAKMTIFEQMGNISSEVGRSFNAKRNNDSDGCLNAIWRAIDLFDATTEILILRKSYRVKEVLRSKDQYLSAILDNVDKPKDDSSIEQYFMQYAIASRLVS